MDIIKLKEIPLDLKICLDCPNESKYIRYTQFAGNHPFCEDCARKQKDFDNNNNVDIIWKEIIN